jgi:hypothetical protein
LLHEHLVNICDWPLQSSNSIVDVPPKS